MRGRYVVSSRPSLPAEVSCPHTNQSLLVVCSFVRPPALCFRLLIIFKVMRAESRLTLDLTYERLHGAIDTFNSHLMKPLTPVPCVKTAAAYDGEGTKGVENGTVTYRSYRITHDT